MNNNLSPETKQFVTDLFKATTAIVEQAGKLAAAGEPARKAAQHLWEVTAPAREHLKILEDTVQHLHGVSTGIARDREGARSPKYDGTLRSLVHVIAFDEINFALSGVPRKFPSPGDRETLLDMPTAIGKPLGKCTGAEVAMLGEAYTKVGELEPFFAALADVPAAIPGPG